MFIMRNWGLSAGIQKPGFWSYRDFSQQIQHRNPVSNKIVESIRIYIKYVLTHAEYDKVDTLRSEDTEILRTELV